MVRWAPFDDLDTTTLYSLLRLRGDVFVAEQGSAYADLDGRDTELSTLHAWVEDEGGRPVAYLRVLDDGDSWRIGRVVTAADHRHQGLAAHLMEAALQRVTGPVVLDAQQYLTSWYQRYGFVESGPPYLDDGIPHVPMRLDRTG